MVITYIFSAIPDSISFDPEDLHVSLNTSSRIVQKSISGQCNSGGKSDVPVVKAGPLKCPCFFEWRFYPDTESVWNVFVVSEASYEEWRERQYAGKPARYLEKYSSTNIQGSSGRLLSVDKTNLISEDRLVVAFQAKADVTACIGTQSTSGIANAADNDSFLVFESMPEECPVVVPNPPVRISLEKALPKPNVTLGKPHVGSALGNHVGIQHRVVGGSIAAASDGLATYFPWIAIIWLGTSRSICGGSHIAPGFILTAAHCGIQDAVDSFNVRIGNEEYDDGERFSIKRMWVHEDFRLLANGEAVYDIAIIEIANRNLSKDNDVIELNKDPSMPKAGDYLTTAGYGHLAEGWSKPLNPNPLRKVDIPMWDINSCRSKFPAVSSDLHICAGKGGCDSCQYVYQIISSSQTAKGATCLCLPQPQASNFIFHLSTQS